MLSDMNRLIWLRALALAVVICVCSLRVYAHHDVSAQKRAAEFVFKFFDYVTWPAHKDPSVTGQARLCVYGDHPFGSNLEAIAGVRNGGVAYRVYTIKSLRPARYCHVVYIAPQYYPYLRFGRGKDILTVSDDPGFLAAGGIVQMIQRADGGFDLAIDLHEAEAQNLVMSSQLLKLSDVKR